MDPKAWPTHLDLDELPPEHLAELINYNQSDFFLPHQHNYNPELSVPPPPYCFTAHRCTHNMQRKHCQADIAYYNQGTFGALSSLHCDFCITRQADFYQSGHGLATEPMTRERFASNISELEGGFHVTSNEKLPPSALALASRSILHDIAGDVAVKPASGLSSNSDASFYSVSLGLVPHLLPLDLGCLPGSIHRPEVDLSGYSTDEIDSGELLIPSLNSCPEVRLSSSTSSVDFSGSRGVTSSTTTMDIPSATQQITAILRALIMGIMSEPTWIKAAAARHKASQLRDAAFSISPFGVYISPGAII
ncbi:unnamed protein product [Protopolystoma xenopodis]|uniref:Uncharacterized protein n=1 Tax=Protopolystoma xenopodis TaxID=117903 RepID=A0A3S5CH69_9PLAT|nr:unnamed protein product [Protopolystoma xenopodis]